MKWSKLKQRIEAGFAPSVAGRVEVWSTAYRRAHDQIGEVWITNAGERIATMGTATWLREEGARSSQLRSDQQCADHAAYLTAVDEMREGLNAEGILSEFDARAAMFEYLNMPVEEALASRNPLHRALGMLDSRVGKRRLAKMTMNDELDLVRRCYEIRCVGEGLVPAIEQPET